MAENSSGTRGRGIRQRWLANSVSVVLNKVETNRPGYYKGYGYGYYKKGYYASAQKRQPPKNKGGAKK